MSDKEQLATEILKKYSLYSAGAGLIPVPWVDWAAITGVQLKMLNDLGNVYGVTFDQEKVRDILSALIGGYAATKLGYGIGGGLLKAIPIIGQTVGMLSVPAFAGALSWAIGKVFIQHFASGGTFLDFDPDKVRAYFSSELAKGRAA